MLGHDLISLKKFNPSAGSDYSLPQKPSIHPLKISLLFSVGYFVICAVYIWFSSLIAAHFSTSITDLQRIETIKGISFIFITTISIFLVLLMLLKRLSKDEMQIIDQQQELIKSQQEAVAGIFASSIAHDVNNILIILDYYCDLLLRADYSESRFPETKEKVHYAIGELKDLAKRLMNIGRGNLPGDFSKFNLSQLINDTLKLIRKHRSFHHLSLQYLGVKKLNINGNESIVRQLLINLLLNAAQATGSEGKIEVHLRREGNNAVMEVHDSGPGIPDGEKDSIFEAFYSTRQGGTGLGLLSVKVYAEIHQGQVTVANSHLGGACFRIQIPLQGSENQKR